MGAIATLTTPSPPDAARRWSRSSALAGLLLVAAIVATPGCVWDRENDGYIAISPASSEEPAARPFTGWFWSLHYERTVFCSCSSEAGVGGGVVILDPRERSRLWIDSGQRWFCTCSPSGSDEPIELIPDGPLLLRSWTWAAE